MIYSLPIDIESLLNQSLECFDENWEMIYEERYSEIIRDIEELQNKKDEIIDWILQKRQNSIARQEALSNEIKRLQEQAEKEERTIEKMESLFTHFVPTLEKTTVFGSFQASYRKSVQTIIEDETLIPERFILRETIPETIVVKYPKKEIKEALEAGEEVPGARIQENFNLNIK